MNKSKIIFTFILCIGIFIGNFVYAQDLTKNLSNVKIDELSDNQVRQIIQQAHNENIDDSQIVNDAEKRGLPLPEGYKLQTRINNLLNTQTNNAGLEANSNRKTVYEPDTNSTPKKRSSSGLVIFGSELFSGSNSTFEPNLKLATPTNYILGPEDEININIYGKSLVNWKLTVSAEGNINLPTGGILNVSGKTIEQATEIIKSKLIESHFAIGSGTDLKVTLGDIRSIKVIITGQVVRPGTYTLPSLATAFNALYSAGGPNDNGSYRQIEIIRNNTVIRKLDVYDFLVKGDQKDNIGLKDQDIIRIPSFQVHVELLGEVKTPAIYETLPNETLQDVIRFAGGFTVQAFTTRIKVSQISDQQRRITEIERADYKTYIPQSGDQFLVEKILDRFENRVSISGAVFRPGDYELQEGMTLLQLITKASGLKEDAFMDIGTISRLENDNTRELVSFNVKDVIDKTTSYTLKREDVVNISSIFDLHDQYTVAISGEVRKPGTFAYADGMKVANLIIMAGGFTQGASSKRIEVARRVSDSDPLSKSSVIAKVFSVNLSDSLTAEQTGFELKPSDIVYVYNLPGYEKQNTVQVQGEVLYPGSYIIEQKDEKISDVINRAGGVTANANLDGSTLKRSFTSLIGYDKNKVDTTALVNDRLQRLDQVKQSYSDSTNRNNEKRNNYIGIDLTRILSKPGSKADLTLKDGDILLIPQVQQIVQVNGEVHLPSGVIYEKGKSLKDYIFNAGGWSDDALKRGTYVIYANGSVSGTRKFLFFKSYPDIKPGSEIIVPKKSLRHQLSIGEILGLISALGTTAIVAIISLKN